jgi:hypothetical protein
MVCTPASVARRIPSGVLACATTGRPALAAVSTASRSSASEKVGRDSPFGPQPVVRVQLDHVGAAPDLPAHRTHERVGTVGLLGALRHLPARVEPPGPVAPRGDDGARGDEQPRTRHDPLVDRLLDPDVGVGRALGTRSRSVVKPASSVARRCVTARATRRASGSRSTWSSHDVSSYGCSSTCECASMSPGRSVVPGRATSRAPAATPAAATVATGPAAAMRSPRTSTAHPSCGTPSPSQTRAGRSSSGGDESRAPGAAGGVGLAVGWAPAAAAATTMAPASSGRTSERRARMTGTAWDGGASGRRSDEADADRWVERPTSATALGLGDDGWVERRGRAAARGEARAPGRAAGRAAARLPGPVVRVAPSARRPRRRGVPRRGADLRGYKPVRVPRRVSRTTTSTASPTTWPR